MDDITKVKQEIEELEQKKKKLENRLFHLEMKDGWDPVDFSESRRLTRKIRECKEQIEVGLKYIEEHMDE